MRSKTLRVFIPTIVLLWLTPFVVTTTRADDGGPSLAPTPLVTPNPTFIPYENPQELDSNFSTIASSSSPVRGTPGDWWADVVIGQPSFGQITPNEVVGNKLFNPGGVYVDRSTIPNRVYVYDAGNSRILGFSSLGACTAGGNAGQSCTSSSDCPGSSCAINSSRPADIVLGQPSLNVSACNGDSGFQNYPEFPAPTNRTLCGLRPEGSSILEGGSMATMATDAKGNLYHPDYLNNRILRYNNPFNSDTVADGVWGQADFNHGACNEGRSYGSPDNDSLCIIAPMGSGAQKSGVAVDSNGSLWVADTHNNRVLRFPYNSAIGAPAKTADLVLGQSNFTDAIAGNGLNQMANPASVRVDASGKVYVLDGIDGTSFQGRLLVFVPPLSSGMVASQVFNRSREPTGLELDASGQLWINESDSQQILQLVNGELQPIVVNVPNGAWGGFGIDRDGNVMLTGWESQEVQIYSAPTFNWTSTFLQADEYGFFNHLGPHGMTDPGGLEVTDTQLIVSDQSRLLFWNNPTQLTNNYPPADGVVGQPNFVTRPRWGWRYGRMRADTHGRLWVFRDDASFPHILAYQLPLQSQAQPVIQISSPIPLKGGGSFSWSESLGLGGIAYQAGCDCLWVSDSNFSRVFRINQVSSSDRFVDIVLGQASVNGIHCNQGRDSDDGYVHPQFPSQDSLCRPGGLAFDKYGNLFVSDHNLEVGGNWRLLEYDAVSLPANPNTAVFGLPASRVYGRNGSFTDPNCHLDSDPMCGAWEPVFYPNNDMVVGFNGYLGPHFPQVYQDPLTHTLPYAALRDYYSHGYSARLDSQNNLYVLDLTRSHVLIYRAITPQRPGPATPLAPSGTVISLQPEFSWSISPDDATYDPATWYYLWINSPSGKALAQWYEASSICSGSTCSVTPNLSLVSGTQYTWWVQSWNVAGTSPWSAPTTFDPYPVGEATPISPSNNIGATYNPAYTWSSVSDATWYYLWVNGPNGNVIKQWYTSVGANCNGITCSVTPAKTLGGGNYTWWIETWNPAGIGPWSNGMNFTTTPLPPATLVSPNGNISTNYNPTYTWNKVTGATWYYLWVEGPSEPVIQQWYTSADANCNSTTCSVTPAKTLSGGNHTWWIQTWNAAGLGPWSSGMSFTTTPLGAATLVSPSGSIASHNPSYTWNAVPGATWYYLWVNGPSGNVIKQWYTSAQANCNASTCSVTPATTLSSGSHTWWIQTWNAAELGPWSSARNFHVTP